MAESKKTKAELARQKRTNKALSVMLIFMEKKAEELEEEVNFQEGKKRRQTSSLNP